ncbi:MAG: radical SAM protein [Candidatus Zhuqueibacterota bacterium]
MVDRNDNPIFFIPVEDKYLVYLPFKPLAFIANQAMKEVLTDVHGTHERRGVQPEAITILEQIGYFSPNRRTLRGVHKTLAERPTTCVLLLTTACNLQCVYCYASSGNRTGKVMPVETGKKAIDIACRNATEQRKDSFTLSIHGGGEPTVVKKQLFELIRYAGGKALPCKISLTTNGYLKKTEAEQILDLGISEVSLSCDGLPEIQNRQRPAAAGKPSFDRVFETMNAIDERNIPYGIRLSVMDDSIESLPASIDFLCRESRCNVFQVEPVFSHGRAHLKNNYLKNYRAFASVFTKALEIANSHERHLYYSGARPWIVTDQFCLARDVALIVNHDSELTACYEVYDREHALSDLFFYGRLDENGALHINEAKQKKLADKIEARKAQCKAKGCFCYYHCAGDCPPKAFHDGDSGRNGYSPRCQLNRELTRELLLYYVEKSGSVWHGEKIIR